MKISYSLIFKYSSQLLLLLLFCSSVAPFVVAEQAPPEIAKMQLVEVSEKAKAIVASAGDLLRDEEFINIFKGVLQDDTLDTVDKIDVFYLMQREIGWGFNGALTIYPGMSYFDLFVGQISTYTKYQTALRSLSIDLSPFLKFSEAMRTEDEARAATSLLLSSLIDPVNSVATIRATLAITSDDTPILLHFGTQAAALVQEESLAQAIADLLLRLKSEESKEDAIAALACFSNAAAYHGVSGFVMTNAVRPFDQEVETALHAMKARMQPTVFAEFYAELKNRTSDEKALEQLKAFEESGFRYSLTRPTRRAIKVWDQFMMAMFEDGYLVARNDKKDFVSYKK